MPEFSNLQRVLASSGLLLLGLLLLAGVRALGVTSDGPAVTVLLLPLALYLLLSDRVTELRGPGFVLKLKELSRRAVGEELIAKANTAFINVVKGGAEELKQFLAGSPPQAASPLVLALTMGNTYTYQGLKTWIEGLLARYPRFGLLVVVDKSQAVLCVSTPEKVLGSDQADVEAFLALLTVSDLTSLAQSLMCLGKPLSKRASYIEALKAMTAAEASSWPVTGPGNKLVGVLERESVTAEILLAIATASGP